MGALQRKLLRDLWRLRVQVLSIALVVACGISAVVVFRSALDSVEASRDDYYRTARFADVFVTAERAPESLLPRILAIPGVAAAEPRVSLQVTLDVPGLGEPATAHLVSIPDADGPHLNSLHLRSGRFPVSGRSGEALVSEQFALANQLRIGDTLGAVINERWERLRLVGIALSPEFIYAAQPGFLFTDDRRFGILWLDHRELAAAYGMEGAFNDLVIELAPGASEPGVIDAVDRLLDPYGGYGAYGRADQVSNRVISDEIRRNRIWATMFPGIFLFVAGFLLSVVLNRLVTTEREQIAVLKAFGYTDREIGWHYLGFAISAVILGSAIGIGVGLWLGRSLMGLYAESLRFPRLDYQPNWTIVLLAVLASSIASGLGAMGAVLRAARLPPAEAMRPEAPTRFGHRRIERLLPPGVTPVGQIIIRNLTRQPLRSFNAILGVGLATALLVPTLGLFESIRHAMRVQFGVAQRQDLTVAFNAPRASAVRLDLANLPGVWHVELFRSVPVRLRAGWRVRQVALTGLEARTELNRVMDTRQVAVTLPERGLVLSRTLADLLAVSPGDTVVAEVLEGERLHLRLPVAGTVDEFLGTNAYIEIGALARLLRETPTASGAHLAVDAAELARVNALLERTPLVSGIASPRTMLASFEKEMGRNFDINLMIISIFAGIVALGVVYNGARIALSERGRELASLRVLGFTVHEIAVILLGEQAVVTAAGLPIGFGLGVLLYQWLASALSGEVFRIPLIIRADEFAISAGIVAAAALLAGLAVRRRLAHLDLIAVLKTRE